ncbi:MAG: hypothetical protein LQ347_005884 [Umbilicaria vellea]|nr:MAG: hypothetical protein LQ347_005884 [Umbilicaria vellea]
MLSLSKVRPLIRFGDIDNRAGLTAFNILARSKLIIMTRFVSSFQGTDGQVVLPEPVLASIIAYKMHASGLHVRKNLRRLKDDPADLACLVGLPEME